MANISNAKKYAVLWMNSQNKSLDEISKYCEKDVLVLIEIIKKLKDLK